MGTGAGTAGVEQKGYDDCSRANSWLFLDRVSLLVVFFVVRAKSYRCT